MKCASPRYIVEMSKITHFHCILKLTTLKRLRESCFRHYGNISFDTYFSRLMSIADGCFSPLTQSQSRSIEGNSGSDKAGYNRTTPTDKSEDSIRPKAKSRKVSQV